LIYLRFGSSQCSTVAVGVYSRLGPHRPGSDNPWFRMTTSQIVTVVPPEFLENPNTRRQPHLFNEEPAENQLGPHGRRSNLINRQGLRLTTYFWPAIGEAKGVVLFVHGHAAYLMEQLLLSKASLQGSHGR
jgi:hypothetical protein